MCERISPQALHGALIHMGLAAAADDTCAAADTSALLEALGAAAAAAAPALDPELLSHLPARARHRRRRSGSTRTLFPRALPATLARLSTRSLRPGRSRGP
eukprot:8755090-Pyramimonas_sp.AAC.1